jgi:hypothetical protein
MKAYFERQIPWGVILPIIAFFVFITSSLFYQGKQVPLLYSIIIVFVLVTALLHCIKMDTRIDDTHIKIGFCMSYLNKKIALSDIYSVSCIKLKWYDGTVFAMHSRGNLYRAKFTDVVELRLKGSNKTIQIGSKDVEGLRQAIEARL